MMRSRSAGASDRAADSGGAGSFMMDDSSESPVSPWNGREPVAISYSTTPSEKMSERASTGFPFACSGDMYAAVPTTSCGAVTRAVVAGPNPATGVAGLSLAMPKSRTFSRPPLPIMMFAGLMSR